MAPNKFATMLHRNNTHRMGVVLVYTLLEWILIALLLLNGFFSYLISKFADYFGLKPPCVFCTRVDRLFEASAAGGEGRTSSCRGLVCDDHAVMVSKLGYCGNHRRLADAGDMCEDCSASRAGAAVLSWMKRSEEGEKDLRCSCCDVVLENGFYSPYVILKSSSWGVLECTQKEELVEEIVGGQHGLHDDEILNQEGLVKPKDFFIDHGEEGEKDRGLVKGENDTSDGVVEQQEEEEGSILLQSCDTVGFLVEDSSLEVLTLHLESNLDEDRLVPVELIDFTTMMKSPDLVEHYKDDGDCSSDHKFGCPQSTLVVGIDTEESDTGFAVKEVMEMDELLALERVEVIQEDSLQSLDEEFNGEDCLCEHQCALCSTGLMAVSLQGSVSVAELESFEVAKAFSELQDVEIGSFAAAEDFGELQAVEEDSKVTDGEPEVSIGSEICDQEHIDQDHANEATLLSIGIEGRFSERDNETAEKDQMIKVEATARGVDHASLSTEVNEVEEERAPETPTYVDGIYALNRRFLFERRESGTESIDGSIASEIEGSELPTVEQLKSALKAERKALSALYAELEEERSASAISANQTMAMITRLQEEKAAMQMEAFQYQRMMEEQSEYDQDALQLLNELMMKREREKQELEKELEVYRKKVRLYEARERRKMTRSKADGRSGTSSASLSAEESDDLSSEFNEGDEFSYSPNESNQNTPTDAILGSEADHETSKDLVTLDDSLAEFEEERLSILEQLKTLEEKLFTMDDEEISASVRVIEQFSRENGHDSNGHYESSGDDLHDIVNGFSDDMDPTEKLPSEHRSVVCKGKRLLPLFDAIAMENEDEECRNGEATDTSPECLSKYTVEQEKLAIAEEVDDVYERLQALEADREFLKHCVSSLKKGDKGMDLLKEILQHLRDLRNVELRVKSAGDALASLSA